MFRVDTEFIIISRFFSTFCQLFVKFSWHISLVIVKEMFSNLHLNCVFFHIYNYISFLEKNSKFHLALSFHNLKTSANFHNLIFSTINQIRPRKVVRIWD